MATKVALVVDDSKSARLVLRRMLEKYDITAETVESAADALDYLSHHRPDVIFMDHMMPGMDGFEAVRRIKANPQTVTIPVLMYTSKGGDLYLGQARALGAVGILPKTVAPAELYDSLLRLGLTRDRRSAERTADADDEETASERVTDISERTFGSWNFGDEPPRIHAEPPSGEEETLRRLLEEMRVELRKDLLVSIDAVSRNVSNKLHHDIGEKITRLEASRPEPPSYRLPLTLMGALALLLAAWNFNLHRSVNDLQTSAAESRHAADIASAMENRGEIQPSAQDSSQQKDDWQNLQWALNQSTEYPYDELALDGDRIQLVDNLVNRLKEAGFKGKLVLVTHVGEFCLNGDNQRGFELAPPDLPVDRCEFVGNPVQPTDQASSHQSLSFANFADSLDEKGPVQLELVALPRNRTLYPYPERNESTRAGDWNRAAARNNRVLVRLEPADQPGS